MGSFCRTGWCQPSRCSKIDYAGWDHDASTLPPVVEYDCLVCVARELADAGSQASDDGGVQTSDDSGVHTESDGGVDAGSDGDAHASSHGSAHTSNEGAAAVSDAGQVAHASGSPGDGETAKDADGCVVAPARLGSHAAALALAGVLGWFIGRLRRRRS